MTTPNFEDAERELQRVEESERAKMQDRTKAIVEAAERFADSPSEHELLHVCDECRERLFALRDAIALPSPQWTRTPPSEPGYYWVRRTDGEGDQMEFLVLAMPQVNETRSLELGDGTMDLSDVLGPEWVWFPVRIEEPPA